VFTSAAQISPATSSIATSANSATQFAQQLEQRCHFHVADLCLSRLARLLSGETTVGLIASPLARSLLSSLIPPERPRI
jgi:hypothetical protein